MSDDNLPRVTYSNVGVDFTPVHDRLDGLIPDFKKGLGRSWPNLIGGRADREGTAYKASCPIDERIVLGEFIEASPAAIDRAVKAAKAAYPAWSGLSWQERVASCARPRRSWRGANTSSASLA